MLEIVVQRNRIAKLRKCHRHSVNRILEFCWGGLKFIFLKFVEIRPKELD